MQWKTILTHLLAISLLIVSAVAQEENKDELKMLKSRIRRHLQERRSLDDLSSFDNGASEMSESNGGASEQGCSGSNGNGVNGIPRMSTSNSKQKATNIAQKAAQEAKAASEAQNMAGQQVTLRFLFLHHV